MMVSHRAIEADLPVLCQLCVDMHRESDFRDLALDRDKLTSTLVRSMRQDDKLFLQVYERHSRVVGYLLGMLTEPFFSTDVVAVDLMFYVAPESRGGPAAFRLWTSFGDWAKQKGAKELRQGVTTGITPERTGRFFQKLGMVPVGTNYRLQL